MNKSKNRQVAAKIAAPAKRSEEPTTPDASIENINESLAAVQEELTKLIPDPGLSEADRRRLNGSGVRRYGFIDKVHDISEENQEFIPPFMSEDELEQCLRDIETLRNILVTLQQLNRMASDLSLLTGDNAFRIARMYYTSVREAARKRVPGAEGVYEALKPFFNKRSGKSSDQPTEAEIKHDVNALLHGKKEGKIVIENEAPRIVKGKKIIIDETEKRKSGGRSWEEEDRS